MSAGENRGRPLSSIANDFFTYLGRHLPQQCADDEFYFLPRSEAAIQHLHKLDNLSPESIPDHVKYVENLLLEIPSYQQDDPETEADRLLLRKSMKCFVMEFGASEIWRNDPTLYAKIPLFAVDRIISQKDISTDQLKGSLSAVLGQIPSFLNTAFENLQSPSEISLQVAVDITQDALFFHNRPIRGFIKEKIREDKGLLLKNKEALLAWEGYKKKLLQLPSGNSFAVGESRLGDIVTVNLDYPKSLDTILEIAKEARQKTLNKLHTYAEKIDSSKAWKQIIYEQPPPISSSTELLELFQKEVQTLRRFFSTKDIISFPSKEEVIVQQTPSFLQSLRATASYRAPLTGSHAKPGVFYITPGKDDLELISSHCPYLSAHETYPGHHILDYFRTHHPNPMRRQIESPLYYEGWACYAEQLLDEQGYIEDPRKQLIRLKRQLWRCVRAILDIELQTGKISFAQAVKKIEVVGFPLQRAQHQVRRFCLTPGYQLCYFTGMYEILRLRRDFSSHMTPRTFHDVLLSGGQLPFYLIERRLKDSLDN
ncbi:MAG: DUF885 domain-containing protein [Desulfobacterales bacterium]|nr:DUF885 domain-containing protein [Desulfobacterales bacterium]